MKPAGQHISQLPILLSHGYYSPWFIVVYRQSPVWKLCDASESQSSKIRVSHSLLAPWRHMKDYREDLIHSYVWHYMGWMARLTPRPLQPTRIDYEARWTRGPARTLDLPDLRILFLIHYPSQVSKEDDQPCAAIYTCISKCCSYQYIHQIDHPSLQKCYAVTPRIAIPCGCMQQAFSKDSLLVPVRVSSLAYLCLYAHGHHSWLRNPRISVVRH